MQMPVNSFKAALRRGDTQLGLWAGLADATAVEALAGVGFHWLLLDAEHAPNDVRSVLSQLRAVAPYPVHPVVRPPQADVAIVKQFLDIGAQTLLIPMVDTAEQARCMVRAMRYPPEGVRGVGAALARASRWNQVERYLEVADGEMCLLVQAESKLALHNLEAIAAVEGVDGVFFGPADLSASLGYRGQPAHPAVRQAISDGIARVRAAGKAAGVLATDRALAQAYLQAGASFVAVGVDTTLLVRAAADLLQAFTGTARSADPGASGATAY